MNEYNVITNIPRMFDFSHLTRKEITAYKKWFFENESIRLTELKKKVKQAGFPDLNLDFSPESLIGLGDFMAAAIRTRPRTASEIEQYRIIKRIPAYIGIRSWDITDESYTLCLDLAIYWGNVFIKHHPNLSWGICRSRSTRNVDYGQMVIEYNPLSWVNPGLSMYGSALEIAEGTFDRESLYKRYLRTCERHELYLQWCNEFGPLDKKTLRELYSNWWHEKMHKSAEQENQATKSDTNYKSENHENKNNLITNLPTLEKLESYRKSFFENESLRIIDLKNKVKQSDFSDLDLDFTPESLIGLGDFMAASIRTRPRTELEIEKTREALKKKYDSSMHESIVVAPWELTTETYSLCLDLAIYWGNVLIKNHPTDNLSWSQYLHKKRKNNDDYGQMIIQVNPRSYVAPFRMTEILASHVAYGIYNRNSRYTLYKIYQHWSKKVNK